MERRNLFCRAAQFAASSEIEVKRTKDLFIRWAGHTEKTITNVPQQSTRPRAPVLTLRYLLPTFLRAAILCSCPWRNLQQGGPTKKVIHHPHGPLVPPTA